MHKRNWVRTTDEEWGRLADLVWAMRSNDPMTGPVALANRAMSQFPVDRRRTFQLGAQIEPMLERMQARDHGYRECVEELQKTKQALASYSAEDTSAKEVLGALSDQEVLNLYKERVLSQLKASELVERFDTRSVVACISTGELAGEVARRIVDSLNVSAPQEPVVTDSEPRQMQNNSPPRRKRVAVIGLLNAQSGTLQKQVPTADIIAVPKGHSIPRADLYVAWTKFISHSDEARIRAVSSTEKDKFIRHNGGLSQMAKLIGGRL